MLGFGSMVGVGWAVSSNRWLAQAGGPWPAFIGFLIGTLLLVPIGLAHAELMSAMPVSGGVMVYAYKAFGTALSFLGSWFVALAYLTILPWEAIYINRILTNLFPFLQWGEPVYQILGSNIYLSNILLGLLFAIILFVINIRGSKLAGKVQRYLSYLIIVSGVIVIVFALVKGNFANLRPFYENIGVGKHKSAFSGILTMIVLVPFFMAGFDTIPQSIEERHPGESYRKISIVLVLSILAAGIFYAFIILSTGSATPWREYATQDAPAMALMLQELYGGVTGTSLYWIIMIGTLAGLFSTWNGMFMAAARLLQSMGKAGLLPEFFKKEHPKYRTPIGGGIFCFVAAALGPAVGFSLIDSLTSLGSVAFVLGWFITCLAALKIRKSEEELKVRYEAPGGLNTIRLAVVISALIVLLCFIPGQVAYMGNIALVLFLVWLLAGAIFYYFTNYGSRGMSEEERQSILFPEK